MPVLRRPGGREVGVEHDQRGVVAAARRRSRTPGRSAGAAPLSVASMFAGDMFLPAALMISSFLRSTIVHVAVLVDLADVAGVQPAVGVDRLGGLLGQVAVAGHHDRRSASAARRPRRA